MSLFGAGREPDPAQKDDYTDKQTDQRADHHLAGNSLHPNQANRHMFCTIKAGLTVAVGILGIELRYFQALPPMGSGHASPAALGCLHPAVPLGCHRAYCCLTPDAPESRWRRLRPAPALG